jgi:outer membrane protein assembly factor BamB
LWKRDFETGPLPSIMPPNEQASTTPASDGERVYVYFSTVGLLAFDLQDGKLLWKRPIQLPFYLLGWGAAHSPIVYEDMVIFNQDDDLDPFLLALDKFTGEVRWRTLRPEMLAGYAVPVICKASGQTDIVVAGSGKLKGYDPKTGKERWTCNTLLRTIMTTPAVVDDTIFVSVQSYGDTDRVLKFALLQWKDTNQDKKLDKSEFDKAFWDKFDKGDRNKDGFLEDTEIDAAFQAPTNMVGGGNIIQAIKGGGQGDVSKTHMLWNLDNTAPSNIASPLVVDGRLFVVKKGGISGCFDAKSGETIWPKERINNFGNYYASPIAGDGKIYVMGENGYLMVLKQGDQVEILAKNDMGESCTATPAIADGRIYVRTLTKLYCFSKDGK